jgi:hypothetical protein
MTPDHAHFADWDAAFVLGALSPADRRVFEEHLERCDRCRAAIAEIAPTIGLLSRVAPDRARSMLDGPGQQDGPDAAARAAMVSAVLRRSKQRRRAWWAGSLALAAVVIVAITLVVSAVVLPSLRGGGEVVALEPVAEIPVTATVELTDVAWGTRIELVCAYGDLADGSGEDGWPYALVVTSVDGTSSEVSSWLAFPGKTAKLSAGTALSVGDIASIDIRSVDSGYVLMRTELTEPDGGE